MARITHLAEQMHRSEDDSGTPITDDFLLAADGASGLKWVDPSTLGGGLVIEEVDGAPSVTATELVFPNGTLGVVGTVATYTPATPGSTVDIEDEGAAEGAADTIDFTGAGVSVTFAGGTATVNIPGGGGGGGLDWDLEIDENGTSFANFTSVSGTWSSNGTEIIQTNNAASFVKCYHTTKAQIGFPSILEVEVWFHAAGQGGGGLNYASLQLGFNGTSDGAPCIILDRGAGVMRWQLWGVTDITTVATTVNADTWYKIRLVADGHRIAGYKDGTLLGTASYQQGNAVAHYIGLGTYASTVKFRNLKVWTLSTGAPA
jgi:hypothetical protein